MLEAVATPAAGDDLGFQVAQVECDRPPRIGVEVLEGNGGGVGAMGLGEPQIWRGGEADPGQIGLGRAQRRHQKRRAKTAPSGLEG